MRRAVSKQRLSHWIVDAITAAYTNQVWNVLYTLGGIQQGLWLPRGLGREVCLFKIYVLQPAGLLRILSPGFTGWTFSLLPPRCCR